MAQRVVLTDDLDGSERANNKASCRTIFLSDPCPPGRWHVAIASGPDQTSTGSLCDNTLKIDDVE
jgi:hypothetical protein